MARCGSKPYLGGVIVINTFPKGTGWFFNWSALKKHPVSNIRFFQELRLTMNNLGEPITEEEVKAMMNDGVLVICSR